MMFLFPWLLYMYFIGSRRSTLSFWWDWGAVCRHCGLGLRIGRFIACVLLLLRSGSHRFRLDIHQGLRCGEVAG